MRKPAKKKHVCYRWCKVGYRMEFYSATNLGLTSMSKREEVAMQCLDSAGA